MPERKFREGDYVVGKFGHSGYAFNITTGFAGRQYMSIHLEDGIDHFTRVVHSSGDEVCLVRDDAVEHAERAIERCRDAIKHYADQIAWLERQREQAKRDLAEARKEKREAMKIPLKIERPKRVNEPKAVA